MIVLSSTSASRKRLLTQAGLYFRTAKPPVDEAPIKEALKKNGATATQVAEALAQCKAESVAQIVPGSYVIGADQMLECDGVWYDKPEGIEGARRHLQALRGKTHQLITAAVIVHGGAIIWRHVETAQMSMRPFSDEFLEHYLDNAGDGIVHSVGAYELEGIGVQLFDRIDGDFFAILGLPVVPLLTALREAGAPVK